MSTNPHGPSPSIPPAAARALFAVAMAAFLMVAIRCAWMSDDAFITMRHLENLRLGHGLRYNIAERVQAFTHPLWALLLLPGHLLTADPYYLPLLTSLAVGSFAVGVASAGTVSWTRASAGLVLYGGSKALVDFTTSGLENPLTHLLVALFVVEVLGRRRLAVLGILTGLMATNRLDTILLVAPTLALSAWASRRWLPLLWTLPPLVAWHSFALVYYGFALPNTAYAKLGHGIPRWDLVRAGGYWLDWALRCDPATVLVGCAGALAGLLDRRFRPLVAGVALYVLYVVWVGGDFMGDRFLSTPILVLVVPLLHLPPRVLGAATFLGVLTSLASPWSPWRSGPDYRKAPARNGIVDERGYYWRGAGWFSSLPGDRPAHRFVRTGERLAEGEREHVMKATAGFVGYYAGPETHVVDPLGLTDPLLARVPAEFDPDWRTGHFRRHVPPSYVAHAAAGDVTLDEPDAQALYDALQVVTRGPLFSAERWRTILALHTGAYTVDPDPWRYPDLRRSKEAPVQIPPGGMMVVLPDDARQVEVELGAPRSMPPRAPWTVRADDGESPLHTWSLQPGSHVLDLPRGAQRLLLIPRRSAKLLACTPCEVP